MHELLPRLQTAVGDTYRIERELGGGGMSRVFLAEEVALRRQVVIKVLPPDMAATVNKERFHREIELAASLQHPHIVPLLAARSGSADDTDLLYYVMPFIKGESLRAKLTRDGELPVRETTQILEQVADALAYAHRHGVVHRDIKPDNVLLSEGHALVTDFGVARAVSSDGGDESSITSIGVALGTPAYMAPEQAAADPHVDHRADVYALGALAYEMLCGRPPFLGSTPQQVLAAHVSQQPDPVRMHRETIPAALSEIVMRCLAKRPADRWQSADELRAHLRETVTPSGAVTPTETAPTAAVQTEGVRSGPSIPHVIGFYVVGSLGVLGIAYGLMVSLGLPGWVVPAAAALLVIGAPILVATSKAETARATGEIAAGTTGSVLAHRWFTWRNALRVGALAFAALTAAVALYMGTRLLGIGPFGTLMATGVIEDQEQLILADFDNRTSDTTLGRAVTELFRIDLSQSPNVNLLPPSQIVSVLQRMERVPSTSLTLDVAREIAQREGLKAVMAGDILTVGENVVVSVTLVEARTGQVLTARRVTTSMDDLIESIDDLSADVRERIGESLRSIRADPPLERVTTRSLVALQKYVQAEVPFNQDDYERAATLLEEAIAADSNFAMAYRRLGVTAVNRGDMADSAAALFTKAYELRERLTERERYLAEAVYHQYAQDDDDASIAAYRNVLERYPTDPIALNNLGNHYQDDDRFADAAELFLRSIEARVAPANTFSGAFHALGHLEDLDRATRVQEQFAAIHPENPSVRVTFFELATIRRDYDAARAHADTLRQEHREDNWQRTAFFWESTLARVHGRLLESARLLERARDSVTALNRFYDRLNDANRVMYYRDDTDRARAILDSLLSGPGREVLLEMDPPARPYQWIAEMYARAGDPETAKHWLQEYEAEVDLETRRDRHTHVQLGWIALAEGDVSSAIAEFRQAQEQDRASCTICGLFPLGVAYDRAGEADSAIAMFEAYLNSGYIHRFTSDQNLLHLVYRMLGWLYEERGDSATAARYYLAFVDLWREADAELQPVVQGARSQIERLAGERR